MAQVSVEKWNEVAAVPTTLIEQIHGIGEAIRQRAFGLFQNRNGGNGSDLEDWLQAERDMIWSPTAELADGEKDYRARLALPGFEEKDIHVSAMPDAVVVQADSSHTHEGTNGDVRYCEFSDKKLFRRIELPGPVDVDKVSASLDKGILQVVAPKMAEKQLRAGA